MYYGQNQTLVTTSSVYFTINLVLSRTSSCNANFFDEWVEFSVAFIKASYLDHDGCKRLCERVNLYVNADAEELL